MLFYGANAPAQYCLNCCLLCQPSLSFREQQFTITTAIKVSASKSLATPKFLSGTIAGPILGCSINADPELSSSPTWLRSSAPKLNKALSSHCYSRSFSESGLQWEITFPVLSLLTRAMEQKKVIHWQLWDQPSTQHRHACVHTPHTYHHPITGDRSQSKPLLFIPVLVRILWRNRTARVTD